MIGYKSWRLYFRIFMALRSSWLMISVKPTRSVNKIAVSLRLTSLKIEYYCNEIEYNFSDLNLETMNITHYIKSKLIIFIKNT